MILKINEFLSVIYPCKKSAAIIGIPINSPNEKIIEINDKIPSII